jgi:hypothetical protein
MQIIFHWLAIEGKKSEMAECAPPEFLGNSVSLPILTMQENCKSTDARNSAYIQSTEFSFM